MRILPLLCAAFLLLGCTVDETIIEDKVCNIISKPGVDCIEGYHCVCDPPGHCRCVKGSALSATGSALSAAPGIAPARALRAVRGEGAIRPARVLRTLRDEGRIRPARVLRTLRDEGRIFPLVEEPISPSVEASRRLLRRQGVFFPAGSSDR